MVKTIFAEKYRPQTLEDVAGQEEAVKSLKGFIEHDKIPHMLFTGPAGVGKTTAAIALAKDLFGKEWKKYFLEMNASDDNGIKTIREKVKNYARIKVVERDYKLIFMDEADNMCLTEDTEIITGSLKNKKIRKLGDMIVGRSIMIPSVNPETLRLEDDRGKLIDSGYTDFYRVTFEDGSIVQASANHPFFKIKNDALSQIKLEDLSIGDSIVEVDEKVFRRCPICGKRTFNKNTCSYECANKLHSQRMSGSGNSMYGKTAWNKGKTKEDDERIAKQGLSGELNPNYGGTWNGPIFWRTATKAQKESARKKLSDRLKGKTYKEIYGEDRELEMRAKTNPSSSIERIKTNIWITEQLSDDYIYCEDCGKKLLTSGRTKNSVYVHHKDGNHDNHTPKNIKFVCPKCHNTVEHEDHFRDWLKLGQQAVHNGLKITDIEFIGRKKAWNITMEKNQNFILSNGVVTHNTKDAQSALRRIIEKYSDTCRFILSCNYPNKIIDPIKDRCVVFRFKKISPQDMTALIKKVVKEENMDMTEDAQKELAKLSHGTMRVILNTLYRLKYGDKSIQTITKKEVRSNMCYVDDKDIQKLVYLAKKGDIKTVEEELENVLYNKGYTTLEIIRALRRLLKESTVLSNTNKIKALVRIGDLDFRIAEGATPDIQLKTYFVYLMQLYKE